MRFFGGLSVHDGDQPVVVRGRGQEALLFRLAIDTGTTVGYRALAEDVWPDDLPADPRASLQSLASRLRRALPADTLEAAPGGYRLTLERRQVDVTHFQDLVAHAGRATDAAEAADLVDQALALWTGEPWVPDGFDWVVRDLLEDRARIEKLRTDAASRPAATPGVPRLGASGLAAPEPVPAPLTALVGRSHELELIADQLAVERVVTLIGPGGAGKTTLAFETARHFPGALLIELAPASAGEVWPAVAGAVDRSIRLGETPAATAASTPRTRVIDALAGRSVLIVLDNCEHVSAEAAGVALELLRGVPGARVLATSREPLGVPGEAFVAVGSLPDADAVELFARRVRAARGAAPDDAEAEAVGRIVLRLDRLPLALELAAAKTRTLTIDEIDRGLDDRFALLASGPRAADPRHQTLRALIDWSWETLPDAERVALRALAVFPDGVGAGDATVVADAFGTSVEAFEGLVDRSLLRRADGRFRMLETVREYGLDRLRTEGHERDFRSRHARALADLAEPQDRLLRGPRVRTALAWFDANEENLTAAVRATGEADGEHDVGVRLVRASVWAWMMRERFEAMQHGLTEFADYTYPPKSEPELVVGALAALFTALAAVGGAFQVMPAEDADEVLATFAARADDFIAAAGRHRSELSAVFPPLLTAAKSALTRNAPGPIWTMSLVLGDEGLDDAPAWTRAFVSMMRAAIAQNSGDVDTLGSESERALALFRADGDAWGIAFASQMRSEWLMLQGRLEEALEIADASTQGLTGLTSVSDVIQQRALSLSLLVRIGRIAEARERLAEIEAAAAADGSERTLAQAAAAGASLEIAVGDGEAALRHLDQRAFDMHPGPPDQLVAWASTQRAQALLLCGRPEEARTELTAALPSALRSGDQPILAETLLTLAAYLHDVGDDDNARRALVASVRVRGKLDATNPGVTRLIDALGADTVAETLAHAEAAPEGESPDAASDGFAELIALLD